MEESSETPVKSRKSRYFTVVKSSYSLRKTPARSESKPSLNSAKISTPEPLSSSSVSKPQATASLKSLPRRYPSRVRVSAVYNSPDSTPKMATNEEEEPDSQLKIKQILQGFRETYGKLLQEENRKKTKQPGKLRLDLAAYNLYREENKYLCNATTSPGSIPGVKVGDEFNFIVELFLTGLHTQLKHFYFRKQGERLVALSIISVSYLEQENNNASKFKSSDVLVCTGSGTKMKDQKMVEANLALKNNIDDGTPVRVILGFKHGKNKEVTYVYSGLYSVEKYWIKKNKHKCKVFMFQLRRLPDQAKFNVSEAREKIRTRIQSNVYNMRRDLSPVKCSSIVKRKREEEEEEESRAECWKRIKQTLHEFKFTYEKLVEEDEAKQMGKKKKELGEGSKVYLNAYMLLKKKNKELRNIRRRLGDIAGVEIGDKFHFRVELCLIGVHCQLQSDIDYIRNDDKLLAVSIVSFRLEQCSESSSSDVLVFSGSGMKSRDQKMVNGNLALKNSIETKTPVRIFHGFRRKPAAAVYIYFGLYSAERCWKKVDKTGQHVFMFQLRRLPGQRKFDIKEAKKFISLKSQTASNKLEDISEGKEKVPIRVVNTVDDEQLLPFKYITEVIRPLNYSPVPLEGCNCVKGCSDSDTCACAVSNGGELPFNRKGDIVEAKPLVYECGPSCKCPPSCYNRVSQRGIKFPLEIFKTKTMGWGVRSRTFIPCGSFICEYIGELLEDEEAQKRTTDEYLFAIGNNYYDASLWEGLSSVPCLQKSASSEAEEDGGFTLDASEYGNVGRFINHNCTPNLYAQNVLYNHDDKRMPHVAFFACEDIPPMQELTYHYNYTIDDVRDSEGNIRKKNCYCGSDECTGRLY